MRRLLLAVAFAASTLSIQTVAVAQPAPDGSRAACEAKWARVVAMGATHGDTEGSFVDKCMSCQAKWDEMVATNATGGQDRGAFMRRCAKGAFFVGDGLVPELLLLGTAGAIVGVTAGTGHGHSTPVSP
ncbi:MAG: hypothetical protein ABSD80_16655 [Caulobacteraceae bacterium]|jgi:NAD(P)-dependent dehydrogenase (short-subunit alcohol dehydrogenase family)